MSSCQKFHIKMLLLCAWAFGLEQNDTVAKPSVILVIVDGMGPTHIEAARWIEYGATQKSYIQSMHEVRAFSTQNVKEELTDSAAAGTCISTGVRTMNGRIARDAYGANLQTLPEFIKQNYKDYQVAVVAKTYATHATPGAFLTHGSDRKNNTELMANLISGNVADLIICAEQKEIDEQITGLQDKFNLVRVKEVEENPDVIRSAGTDKPLFATYAAENVANFADYADGYQFELKNLTRLALERLTAQDRPFFIMVEASRVDMESHGNNATGILGEQIEADRLVRYLQGYVDAHPEQNVQLIVTADHETSGLTFTDSLTDLAGDLPNEQQGYADANARRKARVE